MATARDVAVSARLAQLEDEIKAFRHYDWRTYLLAAVGVIAGAYYFGHRLIDAEVAETQKVRLQLQEEFSTLKRDTQMLALANERAQLLMTDITLAAATWTNGVSAKHTLRHLDRAQATLDSARVEVADNSRALTRLDGVEKVLTVFRGQVAFQIGDHAALRSSGVRLCRDDENSPDGNTMLAYDSLLELSRAPSDELRSKCRRQLESALEGYVLGMESAVYLAVVALDSGDYRTAKRLAKEFQGEAVKTEADLLHEGARSWTFNKIAEGVIALSTFLESPNAKHDFPVLDCYDRFYALNTLEHGILAGIFGRIEKKVLTADEPLALRQASGESDRDSFNNASSYMGRLMRAINRSAGGCVVEPEPTLAEPPIEAPTEDIEYKVQMVPIRPLELPADKDEKSGRRSGNKSDRKGQ